MDYITPSFLKHSSHDSVQGQEPTTEIDSVEAQQGGGAVSQPDNVIKSAASLESPIVPAELVISRGLKPSQGHKSPIKALFRANEPGSFVSIDESGLMLLWTGQKEAYELLRLPEAPNVLGFHALTWTVAAYNADTLRVYPDARLENPYEFKGMGVQVNALDLSPDAHALLIGAADSRVYVWNFFDEKLAGSKKEREKAFQRYVTHGSVVSAVKFHPLGRIFFSGDWIGRINVSLLYNADRFGGEFDQNLFEGRVFSEKRLVSRGGGRSGPGGVAELRCSVDGKYLAVADENGQIDLWQVRSFKQRAILQAHRGMVLDLSISPNSTKVASLGRDARLVVSGIEKDDLGNYSLKVLKDKPISYAKKLIFIDDCYLAVGFGDGHLEFIDVLKEETGN